MRRKDYLTARDIARLTGIHYQTIRNYLRTGEFFRWKRTLPRRTLPLWHKNVVSRIRKKHKEGIARRGRQPNWGGKEC